MPPQTDSVASSLHNDLVRFIVNGRPYEVDSSVPVGETLLTFLRQRLNLRGAKHCCLEGGCGVCTVVASFTDLQTGTKRTCSVCACLTPVHSVSGWVIETVEWLRSSQGPHSLQRALVGFSGTQCGYCSPGVIMTMYGELKNNGLLESSKVERALDGNICRCTGYRPILAAFRSLAKDAPKELSDKLADIEESYQSVCPKSGKACSDQCCPKGSQDIVQEIPSVDDQGDLSIFNESQGAKWYRPITLKRVYEVLRNLEPNETYILTVGNTGQGVYRLTSTPTTSIDMTGVAELYSVSLEAETLAIGANVSLGRCLETFQEMAQKFPKFQHLSKLAKHWEFVANTHVRSVGSWAGNLMLKHANKTFQSDIFITLIAANARLTIGRARDGSRFDVTPEEFLRNDMHGNVIISLSLPALPKNTVLLSYKIGPRAVNAHAYVNGAFRFTLSGDDQFTVTSKPVIVYGGINATFIHASQTETFLTSRKLSEETLRGALATLQNELKPTGNPGEATPKYRSSLAMALFYKAVLNTLGPRVLAIYRSGGLILERPLSSGTQTFDQNKDSWPIGQPVPKLEGNIQVSGEAQYLNDIPKMPGELHAVFVQSEFAKAKIAGVDPSEALRMKGVIAYIDAKNIPTGKNNSALFGETDQIFATDTVSYAGQSIGLIVARDRSTAVAATNLVRVTYVDVEKPVLTINDAIAKSDETTNDEEGTTDEQEKDKNEVNFEDDPKPAAHTVSGSFLHGSQFHFSMEPLAALAYPIEGGFELHSTTQWPTQTQAIVANILGIQNNKVHISIRRLGGAFGSKISRGNVVACAAAVASYALRVPVRIALDLTAHMTLVGWRDPYKTDYKASFDASGKLSRVAVQLTSDAGSNRNEATAMFSFTCIPSVYYAEKWGLKGRVVKTDTAANTYCRTPGTPNAISSMENILERVADTLNADPADIRQLNFLNKTAGQTQAYQPIGPNLVRSRLFPEIRKSSDYDNRKKEVAKFNQLNRWRKRGLSLVPLFYSLDYGTYHQFNTQVVIYEADGSVVVCHGGIEMGQGINTKAAQVASRGLGIPLSYIWTSPTDTVPSANSTVTGGSLGSDMIAFGINKCCIELRKRLDNLKNKLAIENGKEPEWEELVREAYKQNVDLTERHWTGSDDIPKSYDIFGAACLEVELDVLTGQFYVVRADVMQDCGRSLSPDVDVGQVEGAFVMGLGFYTTEEVVFDPKTGQKISNRSWNYKPPTVQDIPVDFRVSFLQKGDNKNGGVLRSKATGEPALCLSYSVVTALREAIKSARVQAGNANWFEIDVPLTVEKIQQLSLVDPKQFSLLSNKI